MDFKNKQELIDFIKNQCNVELQNINNFCGQNPDLLYTEIPRNHKNLVLSVLNRNGIQTNEHLNNKYWIYLKN